MLVFVCIILFASTSIAQPTIYDGYSHYNENARSQALGKTGTISAHGSDVIFSNSALLGNLKGLQVTGGLKMWRGATTRLRESNLENYSNHISLPLHIDHISIAAPLWDISKVLTLSGGCGYTDFYSLDFNHRVEDEYQEIYYEFAYGLPVITTALSINLKDKFSIGVSHHRAVSDEQSYLNEYSSYSPTAGWRTSKTSISMVNTVVINEIGLIWDFAKRIKLSFHYTFPHQWNRKEHRIYSGSEEWISDSESNLGFQEVYIFGIIVSPINKINLFLEYQENQSSVLTDTEVTAFRCGLEYEWIVPFRIGYYSEVLIEWGSPEPLHGFTFGSEIRYNSLQIEPYIIYDSLLAYQGMLLGDGETNTKRFIGGVNISYTF